MTKEESEKRQADNVGLSVAEYRLRRDLLLRQAMDIKEGK